MLLNRSCIICTAAVAGLAATMASAQDAVLEHFYGNGVHSYYERDYFNAKAELSAAIDGGSQDPRVYYYRALANFRTGNSVAARRDLEKGAELESGDVDQFYPVGRSLERVQGRERMMVERYRARARAQALQRQRQRDMVRYEQRRRAEAEVLRQVPLGPAPAPLRPGPGAPPPAAAAEPAAPPATPPPPGTPFDQPPVEPAKDTPFDEAPAAEQPAAEPDPDDPFADQDAEMPAAEPAGDAGDEDDPFATP